MREDHQPGSHHASLVLPRRGREGILLEVPGKTGGSQGRAPAQQLRQKHTCRGQRWHPVGFIEQIKKLPLLIFWEETGLCRIDVLEGPARQTV